MENVETISEAIVCDISFRFSERTFIRMINEIMPIAYANGLPTTKRNQKVGDIF
jgi:hypothetical protein